MRVPRSRSGGEGFVRQIELVSSPLDEYSNARSCARRGPAALLGSRRRRRGMAEKLMIKVNGRVHSVAASPNTPLLYVLRNELRLNGPRFGCGLAQCGVVLGAANGKEIRACITPVAAVAKGASSRSRACRPVEAAAAAARRGCRTDLHPVQQAWIDEQVPQCGYCQNGMMIRATELLNRVKRPTEDQISPHMNTHLCRCGTYPRVTKAIKRAPRRWRRGHRR